MFAPQHANAEGPEHLMAGKCEEIAVEALNIDGKMRDALRAVNHQVTANRMNALTQLSNRVFNTKDVGDLRYRDDLGTLADLRVHFLGSDDAMLVGAQVHQACSCCATHLLPGNKVRVMLHDGDAHLVARLEDRCTEGFSHHIQRFAGVAAKYHVLSMGSADKRRHRFAGGVYRLSRLNRQTVQTAQGVGIHRFVEGTLRIENAGWALSRCGAVQKRKIRIGLKEGKILLVGIGNDGFELFGIHYSHSSSPSMKSSASTPLA